MSLRNLMHLNTQYSIICSKESIWIKMFVSKIIVIFFCVWNLILCVLERKWSIIDTLGSVHSIDRRDVSSKHLLLLWIHNTPNFKYSFGDRYTHRMWRPCVIRESFNTKNNYASTVCHKKNFMVKGRKFGGK